MSECSERTVWNGQHRRQSYHQSAFFDGVDALDEEQQELEALVKSRLKLHKVHDVDQC